MLVRKHASGDIKNLSFVSLLNWICSGNFPEKRQDLGPALLHVLGECSLSKDDPAYGEV
jgi:hypothetical protein